MRYLFILLILLASFFVRAQNVNAVSISLEDINYPFRTDLFPLVIEGQQVRMAFMDVAADANANGKVVVLMHGKNFGSFYWANVMQALTTAGYRVIAIDQIGFGRSSKPDIHYSFDMFCANTHQLLDSLGIKHYSIIGHSTGGMLATRYALTYPNEVDKLILEDPIGLEDYRLLIPYDSMRHLYQQELNKTDEETTKYIKAYFADWKPEYDIYAQILNGWKRSGEFPRQAKAAALTTEMIYQQPVCYEFKYLACPTLIIAGAEDRTVIEKAKVPKNKVASAGQFPQLAESVAKQIPKGSALIIQNCGHIPRLEQKEQFIQGMLTFLR